MGILVMGTKGRDFENGDERSVYSRAIDFLIR